MDEEAPDPSGADEEAGDGAARARPANRTGKCRQG